VTTETLQVMDTDSQIPGMINVIRKELFGERQMRFWISQILIWLLLVCGVPALLMVIPPDIWLDTIGAGVPMAQVDIAIMVFFAMAGTMATLFIPVLTQGEIVDELESGTAAWIISKPVSRTAFILAKFIANTLIFSLFIIVIPGTIGWLLFAGTGAMTLIGYLTGLGLTALVLMWFMYLTILLGVVTKSRSMTMGIAVGVFFGIMFLGQMMPILLVLVPSLMPMMIIPWIAANNLAGLPTPALAPMIPSMIYIPILEILLFVIIAVWIFRKVEL